MNRKTQGIFCLPLHPDWLGWPPSFLSNGTEGAFQRE